MEKTMKMYKKYIMNAQKGISFLVKVCITIVVKFSFGVSICLSQIEPVYNVPSPEVSNLGLYGQIPVSYYTGVPDISIPLHQVNVGSFSIACVVCILTISSCDYLT